MTVTVGGIPLGSGGNYEVIYSDNVNAGTAVCTINAKGNYCTGSQTKTFTITKADLSGARTVMQPASFIYNENPIEPVPMVTLNNATLIHGKDFTVTYSGNNAVGTASYTVNGINNYLGEVSGTFAITKQQSGGNGGDTSKVTSIGGASIAFAEEQYTYTGSAIEPAPVVTLNGETLTKGSDYTVSYTNNVNAGSATCTISGTGSYSGTRSAAFTIAKVDMNDCTATLERSSFSYDGEEHAPTITVTNGGKPMTEGTDYTVTYLNNREVGKASAEIVGKGCFVGSKTVEFDIIKISINDCTVTLGQNSYTYDGREKTPLPTVKVNGKILKRGTDYDLSYADNIEIGKATVTVTGINNCEGTKQQHFSIVKSGTKIVPITQCSISVESSEVYFDGTEKTPAISVHSGSDELEEGRDYTVSYINNIEEGTAIVMVSGIGNYSGTTERVFTILPDDGTHRSDDDNHDDSSDGGQDDSSTPDSQTDSGSDDSRPEDDHAHGDVNGDGNINVTDIALVAAHVKGIKALDGGAVIRADVNDDGEINVTDIAMIAAHIKGIKPLT